MTDRRVVYDHEGQPVTYSDVAPVDPPREFVHGNCSDDCWLCAWAAALLEEYAPMHRHDPRTCREPGCAACEHIADRQATGDEPAETEGTDT